MICPWAGFCQGWAQGIAASLPQRARKPPRPLRHGAVFWLTDVKDRVLLRRRPFTGLLGGTTDLPGTPWRDTPWTEQEILAAAPMPADWRPMGAVRHAFTHFELRIAVFAAQVHTIVGDGFLCPASEIDDQALASVMRKCIRIATSDS